MEEFKEVIILEEGRLTTTVAKIETTLAQEGEDRQKNRLKIQGLKQKQLEAEGWREKREIGDEIAYFQEQNYRRLYQETTILRNPYFGILEIADDDLGPKSYCLGRQSFFDSCNRVLVLDWREAPISRLYYEYEVEEEYAEEIRGRERTGTISAKRQVDTAGGELRQIMERGILLVRGADNNWGRAEAAGPAARKEGEQDHRLPEITSLISGEQFRAITHPESRTIVLQGGAGSGKTTVGLHRIAYLAYQNPERFCPQRILVVMFNRSLQKYISRVLPDLGVKPGVQVETYHSWAGKIFHQTGLPPVYAREAPAEVVRLKKHPLMLKVLDGYLDKLLLKSRQWLREELTSGEARLVEALEAMETMSSFPEFLQWLHRQQALGSLAPEGRWPGVCFRLLTRLADHKIDLYMMFTDRQLLEEVLVREGGVRQKTLDQIVEHQKHLLERQQMDFADAGIVLRLIQCRGQKAALPEYAHIMVDEAQDLSQVELATLLAAADQWQSITICGDMAQKIKAEVTFEGAAGFGRFIEQQQNQLGTEKPAAQTLMVGYRATRPIMELAWKVLGETGSLVSVRDGSPVQIIRTRSYEESLATARDILEGYNRERPQSLVAVVCRYIKDVDRLFKEFQGLGVAGIRRQAREDFSFQPGIIITNAHQVKGLEFSAVMVMNPSREHYREDRASRMLLHVVLTRAADRLWLVGHRPMAYGIEG